MDKERHSDRRGHGRRREIRILQHNMQRSKTVPYEIRTQMDANGDDIILMNEPHSVEGKIPGFGTGVAIACRGSKHDPPMAAVGTKSKTLTPLEVAELCTTHCACMQISDGETEMYAASLYFPPTENIVVGVQQLEKVLRCLRGKRIITGLDANAKSPQLQERRYNTQKANWEVFQRAVTEGIETLKEITLHQAEDVERMAEQLQATLLGACDAAIPKKKWHYRSVPWWTPELNRAKRNTYQARRRYQGAKDPATREQEKLRYRSTRKEYKRMLTRAKIQSWQDFVTKEGKREPWGIAYKTLARKLRGEETTSTLETLLGYTSNWRTTAAAMLSALLPDDQEDTEIEEQKEIRQNSTNPPNVEDTPEFRFEELSGAVKRLRKGKCPGPDLIEVETIQRARGGIHQELLRLMNGCLVWGIFPKRWKVGNIITILKGPDRDRSNPKSYRPICLLSMIGKLLERLMATRIAPIFHDHALSSDRQYGFRPGRSTVDAITKFREKAEQMSEKNRNRTRHIRSL